MRITLINANPLPSPDPESLQTIQTAAALGRRASVELITLKGEGAPVGGYYGITLPPGLKVRQAPGFRMKSPVRFSWNLPFFLLALGRALQLSKADAIIVRNLKLGEFLLKSRRFLKLPPVIFETHEIFAMTYGDELARRGEAPGRKARLLSGRERFVYENSDGLIAITGALAGLLKERFALKGPLLVAPDGVDLDKFRSAPGSTGTGLLYIGSLHHWKGVDTLLKAVSLVPGAELTVVGGDAKAVERYSLMARELGIGGRARFTGFVAPGERFSCFEKAGAFVLPLKETSISRYFTSPLKLFEYMAAGRPVIASDLPSIREVLKDGVNGVLVRPDDPEALAGGIRRLLADRAFGKMLAAQALKDVAAYTWDKRAERITGFIRANWVCAA